MGQANLFFFHMPRLIFYGILQRHFCKDIFAIISDALHKHLLFSLFFIEQENEHRQQCSYGEKYGWETKPGG